MGLLLGPALRHVSDTTALVWVQTENACTVEVLGCSARTFEVQGHHFALVMVTGLTPDSVTEYQVSVDGDDGVAHRRRDVLEVPAQRDPHQGTRERAPAAGHLRVVPLPEDRSQEDRGQAEARRAGLVRDADGRPPDRRVARRADPARRPALRRRASARRAAPRGPAGGATGTATGRPTRWSASPNTNGCTATPGATPRSDG